MEVETDPCTEELQVIFGAGDPPEGYPQDVPYDDTNGLQDQMGRMNLGGGHDNGYDCNPHLDSRAHDTYSCEDRYDNKSSHHLASQNHQRMGSTASH